jgi:hypothetical protein
MLPHVSTSSQPGISRHTRHRIIPLDADPRVV